MENPFSTPAPTDSRKRAYTNDAAGRRTAADWSGSAFTQGDTIGYDYNSRSEVTGATATNRTAYDFDYSYDNIGNRATYAVAGGTATTYTPNEVNQYIGTANPTEAFTYDDDGNLTVDGDFQYTWDAENRLIKVEAAGVVKVEFTYDYMSRRVRKISYDWATDHWSLFTDHLFVYDGWNPVLELASGVDLPSSTVHTWGLDLSQTLQGAGGVGGLLATHLSIQVNAFVYDGNGNVSEALRVSNGSIEAHYEYDPFGNTTASSGTWADANPFRFSTKYLDAETSLYYYGLRYYSPRLGRWASRDPIGEDGGENLSASCANAPVLYVDKNGLAFYWNLGEEEDWWNEAYSPGGKRGTGLRGDPVVNSSVLALPTQVQQEDKCNCLCWLKEPIKYDVTVNMPSLKAVPVGGGVDQYIVGYMGQGYEYPVVVSQYTLKKMTTHEEGHHHDLEEVYDKYIRPLILASAQYVGRDRALRFPCEQQPCTDANCQKLLLGALNYDGRVADFWTEWTKANKARDGKQHLHLVGVTNGRYWLEPESWTKYKGY